jgi:Protein of Unknown function (DUF2784)
VTATFHALAGVVVGLHFGFLAYVIAGGFLAWRWPWSAFLHAGAVVWGLAGLVVRVPCPLTDLENALRGRVGDPPLRSGFIDQYVEGVLYPAHLTPLIRVLVAVTIVASWVGAYTRWARASAARRGVRDGRRWADPVPGDLVRLRDGERHTGAE